MRTLEDLLRPNIRALQPYSCARNEYSGHEARVFLDANENPYNAPLNRYPDPEQRELKKVVARIKGVKPEQICLGNGSDETIDLAYRCFCRPGIDNVVAIEPTYGMYKVCANINDIEYRPVTLNSDFDIEADRILAACDANTKLIWICTPNNPTGNDLDYDQITKILNNFDGIVMVDEAYSDFTHRRAFRYELDEHPNMIVLNTMSKAWGLAGIRLGMAFARKEVIDVFNKVKYPYNVNFLTQNAAHDAFKRAIEVSKWVSTIILERNRMTEAFKMLPMCKRVFKSDANFFLAEMVDADRIYQYLVECGIIVRNRSRVTLCHNCLRITIGTKTENNELLSALRTLNIR